MSDVEKLNSLISEAAELIRLNSDIYSPQLKAWKSKCIRFISNMFGNDSIEFQQFEKIRFGLMVITSQTTKSEEIAAAAAGLEQAKEFLLDILADLDTKDRIENGEDVKNKVFIVHGHDSALKYQVSNLLRKVGIPPIILHEQINASDTIIEKLERYGAEAAAAVILFTPDDFGNVATEEEKRKRARQNVVFEAGFFMGLLGRNKTIIVVTDDNIELPGDLSGVVYSTGETAETAIAAELKRMGLPVDMNKLYE